MARSTLSRLIVIIFIGSGVRAQQHGIEFNHLTLDDGLSQSNILVMMQDYKGFMWFGTQAGLNRFDGYRFTVYKNTGDSLSLTTTWINALFEDLSKQFWIGTRGGGLNLFDQKHERFTALVNRPDDPTSLPNNDVRAIIEDRSGRLLVGTMGGLCVLQRQNMTFARIETLGQIPVISLCEGGDGQFYVGTQDAGLYVLNPSFDIVDHYVHEPMNFTSLNDNTVRAILKDTGNRIWLGTPAGLCRMSGRVFHRFVNDPGDPTSLSSNNVFSIFEDQARVMWIGTEGAGLCRFNEIDNSFTRFYHDPIDRTSLSDDRVYSLLQDRGGTFWVGTGDGIDKWHRSLKKFQSFGRRPGRENSLLHPQVWTVFEDVDGRLWVGTNGGGLNVLDRKTGKYRYYVHDPNDQRSLGSDRVWFVMRDRKGRLWVGTDGGGLNLFDDRTESFRRYLPNPDDPRSIPSDRIKHVWEDAQGSLWLSTRGAGLCRFDPESATVEPFKHDPSNANSIAFNDVYFAKEDRKGNFWVGTLGGGLSRLDRATMTFETFRPNKSVPTAIPSERILTMCEDNMGTVWFGTAGGLTRFDAGARSFRTFSIKDGLPNEHVYGVLCERENILWISTNAGIARVEEQPDGKLAVRSFDRFDGLQGNEFNGGAAFRSARGELFFGGMHGFNAFLPSEIEYNPNPPQVVLTAFRVFDKTENLAVSVSEVREIELTYKSNVFSFDFAALDFASPSKNQYAYIMEGFDSDWIRSGNRHYAAYTNLSGGEYVFRVRASNNDGVWNENGLSVRMIIRPAFWQTWWFRISVTLSVLLLAFGYYRRRMTTIQRQNEILEHRVEERTKSLREMNARIIEMDRLKSEFLANMSHELRTPLNAIIGFSELLMDELHAKVQPDQIQSLQDIHSSGRHLLQLINDILDLSKIEAGRMELHPTKFDIRDLFRTIERTMLPLLAKKAQRLEIAVAPDLPRIFADEPKLKQVIINLLGNANKFSPPGTAITIEAMVTQRHGQRSIQISVADQGPGIRPEFHSMIFDEFRQVDGSSTREGQGTGLGLALCRRLVEMHGGSIWLESTVGQGSVFSFMIPQIVEPSDRLDVTEQISLPSFDSDIILVVEDDPQAANLIRKFLELDGFRVVHLKNGNEVLEEAQKLQPLAITLDIMIPGKDGWQVLQELKSDPSVRDIPVFVVTVTENRELAYSLKADDYFVKPIERDLLVRRIREFEAARRPPIEISHVLVVDDDDKALRMASMVVDKAGFECRTARDGIEAMQMIQSSKPDLLILDLMMPRKNGFQVIEELQKDPLLKDIPVIVLTAKELSVKEREYLNGQVRALMMKAQFSSDELITEIRRVLGDRAIPKETA